MGLKYLNSPQRDLVRLPLAASTADIKVGDVITDTGAATGFYQKVDGSGDAVKGVSLEVVKSPAANGGATVLVDVSPNTNYLASPDAGSVTTALRFKSMDIGADGASIDIDASATDDIYCIDVYTDENTLKVQIRPAFAGVA
ncbi:MAG: hypothetical protein AAFV53_16520 [Myxococcota bacterium]